MRGLIAFLLLMFQTIPVFAYGGKSLPAPKSLPATKTLPGMKAVPSTKSLPTLKAVPKTKKLPTLKALPTPKTLVLKPVFEPQPIDDSAADYVDPRFDPPPMQSTGEQKQLVLQEGVLNMTLDSITQGDIRIVTNENMEKLFVLKSTVLAAFDGNLAPEIYQQIKSHLLDRIWLETEELVDMGFGVRIDKNKLLIDITVPANYRKLKVRQLGGTVVQARTIDIRPASRSASITPFWSRIWRDAVTVTDSLNLDAAVSFDGWVLENDSAYDFLRGFHRRKTTRLVRDFPEQVTRVSAGDVDYKTIGLMGRKALGGVNISREFSLKPNLLTTPLSHQRIFLKNDATLRVFINDIPRQTFSLRAGYYDLQDFPFIDGLNFVKIEVTDIYGQVEILEYLGFDNKKVLVPGITDYSITAGIERIEDEIYSTEYDFSEPAFSAYYRKGIHKNYTVGVLSEGDNGFLSAGGYGVASGVLGTFEASSLFSANFEGKNTAGVGVNLNYYFATPRFTFSNTAYLKSENFFYLGKNNYSALQKYFVSSSVGLPVPYFSRWRQNFSARYEQRWNDTQQGRVSYKLSGRMSKNYTFSSTAFYAVNESINGIDQGVILSLRWTPQKRMSVSAIYDSQFNGQQVDVARGFAGDQGLAMNASASNNDNFGRANGGVNWKTQYFDTRYSGSLTRDKLSDGSLAPDYRRYETFSLTNSFVWVDNTFAMGPPIKNGSFVLFKAGEGLGSGRVGVSKYGDASDRESMPFLDGKGSTALVTSLNQYSTSNAHLLPYLEDGFIGLDKRQYRVFSGYRSGALVTVNKDIKMYGSGVMTNREWEPIDLVKGTFIHESTRQQSRFFTDEDGYFELENIQPGEYQITIDGRRGSGQVRVEATKDNFIDFGILNLEGVH